MRLESKSKQPPELGESLIVPAQLPGAFTLGHWIHSTDDGRRGRDERAANDTSHPQPRDGSHMKHNPTSRRAARRGACALEYLGAAREHVVERILEVRRVLGELLPHLLDVFLVALLDLLAKALAQRAVALPLRVAIGEVRDDV